MGCAASRSAKAFSDKYRTIEELRAGMREANLEDSDMIVAIDMTRSNEASMGGNVSFEGLDLHDLKTLNPYERVMELVGHEVARALDRDAKFPVLAFGDAGSVDHAAGCVYLGDAEGFGAVRPLYRSFVADPRVRKSGPTSFAGVINYTIDHSITTGRFHTLIIITDGQINDSVDVHSAPSGRVAKRSPTMEALIRASQYPIEVIVIGVGDGPWGSMESLDDEVKDVAKSLGMPYRVDCCQFVPFTSYMRTTDPAVLHRFTLACLQEVPQLKAWLDVHGKMGPGASTTTKHAEPVKWSPPEAHVVPMPPPFPVSGMPPPRH
ncbi:hypothetical protein FNF31_05463 [Cafeteria roenbergensis]|nr:hypothetical protein FNF31_05463 [Cafeteria roenbergensis]